MKAVEIFSHLMPKLRLELIDDGESKVLFEIWTSWVTQDGEWEGKPELNDFNESTAIALRDFLNFCFPPKCSSCDATANAHGL